MEDLRTNEEKFRDAEKLLLEIKTLINGHSHTMKVLLTDIFAVVKHIDEK
tara:strand:- start:78 stop:227 length:150 start_codon:yes stop_codon:yes gene_type:complete